MFSPSSFFYLFINFFYLIMYSFHTQKKKQQNGRACSLNAWETKIIPPPFTLPFSIVLFCYALCCCCFRSCFYVRFHFVHIYIRLFDRCRDRSKYPSRIGGSGRIPKTGYCVDSTGRMPPHPGAVRHLSEIPSLSQRSTMVNITPTLSQNTSNKNRKKKETREQNEK